jgi:hypothetical protein
MMADLSLTAHDAAAQGLSGNLDWLTLTVKAPRCSTKVQQRHCTNPTTTNLHGLAGLRHRPLVTAVPPDGKEKVYGSIP